MRLMTLAGKATRQLRSITLARAILFTFAVSAGSQALADDALPPTQQDGSGAGATTLGAVEVNGQQLSREKPKVETSLGVSSSGARFGRNNTPREFNGGENKNEKTDDKDASADCKDTKIGGNPIVLGTGNKIEPELDFASSGVAPLYLERTWNQHWYDIGLFGYHWISNYDYYLKFGADGTDLCNPRPSVPACTTSASATYAWALRPDGRKIKFNKDANGVFWEEKASPVAYLVRESDGTWTLHDDANGLQTYSAGGYLLSKKDAAGIGWTFTYGGLNSTQLQRVTHTSGRYVQFVWTGSELREVRDPAGNSYQYTYVNQKFDEGLHNIGSTTFPGSPATTVTYHYTDNIGAPGFTNLAGKSFNGARYSTFTYNGAYATGTEHAGGVEKFTFAYTAGANNALSVLETNPLGKQATYDFQDGKLMTVTGLASAHCPMTGMGNTYDANGNRDVITDENGNVTNYDYNAKGQLTKLVEASGKPEARTTTYTWDTSSNRVKSITILGQVKTEYAYDADSRLTLVVTTNLINGVLNQTHVTSLSYTKQPSGLLATAKINGPLPGTGDEITYTYNSTGDLIEAKNSLGHATSYSNYNGLGLPGRIIGPNGDITDYVYDARGRVTDVKPIVNGTVQTTKHYYDAMSHVILTVAPDGHWEGREYDAAGRLTSVYSPESGGTYAQMRYTYNNASLPIRIDTERVSGVTLSGPPPVVAPTVTAPSSNTTSSYSVSWTAVSGAMTYQLDENFNGGTWTQALNAAATSKAMSNKPNGTYGYRARACSNAGCGPYSATVNTMVNNPLPLTPVLSAPDYSTGTYTVSWSGVTNVTSYQLDENVNGGVWSQVYSGGSTALLRSKATGNYGYRVRACNANGCSANSAVKFITVEKESCPSCLMTSASIEESAISTDEGEGA